MLNGTFLVCFDGLECDLPFNILIGHYSGKTLCHIPMYVSPFGLPLSCAAIDVDPDSMTVIENGLNDFLPKIRSYDYDENSVLDLDLVPFLYDRVFEGSVWKNKMNMLLEPGFELVCDVCKTH